MSNFTCIPDFTYFDSPEFLKLTLHIFTTISTPVYCLGVYCILFKTPEQMKSVKWNLFTLHIWITIFDYSISLLTVPYLLIPAPAGIPFGLYMYLGVPASIQTVITTTILTYMMIAILSVYENRFFILCEFRFKKQWIAGRKVWLFLHYLIVVLCYQTIFLMVPEQEKAKQDVFRNLPCLPGYVYNGPVFVLFDDLLLPTILFAPMCATIGPEMLIFHYFLITAGKEYKKSMSQKTYQMHKQFFIALVIQLTTPVCMLVIPLIYGYATILTNYYNQAAMNFVVIVFTTHGFVATLTMILVHRPYRLAVREIIRRKKWMIRKSTIVSVNLS